MSFPAPTKVPIYSPTDLKNTTDDHLAPYLASLPQPYQFTASHTHSTIRLALGYTAVAIAAALFVTDYKFGWDVTKPYTLPACLLYFTLNGALTAYVYFVERGIVFVGTREGGQTLMLQSRGKKHSSEYALSVKYQAPNGEKVWEDKVVTGQFMQWFSKEGYLQRKEFARWLGENVEVLGLAEKEKLRIEGGKQEKTEVGDRDVHVTDGFTDDVIEVDVATTFTPGGKKSKGRKKA